jgi:hypothetical protein
MNIIKRYLEYRRNGKAVRHHEYVLPQIEEHPLFIGSPSLEDVVRTHSPLKDNQVTTVMTATTDESPTTGRRTFGDTLTPLDYRGENAEAIKLYERYRK